MNEPDAAAEQIDETVTPGAEPELTFNPHIAPPEGDDEQEEKEEKVADSPPASEGDTDEKEPDDNLLTKKVGELAFENRQLKRRLEREAQPEEAAEPFKTLKDFDYDEQAHTAYLAAEISSRTAKDLERRGVVSERDSSAQELADKFAAREAAFEAESPGFVTRLHADDLMITSEMAEFIRDPESDVGLHVGDYLSRNKAEAARIALLNPVAQAREMTKLESTIGKQVAKAKSEKTKASKAPPPPAGIDGVDAGLKVSPSDPNTADKMSDEEWLAARQKQLSK